MVRFAVLHRHSTEAGKEPDGSLGGADAGERADAGEQRRRLGSGEIGMGERSGFEDSGVVV